MIALMIEAMAGSRLGLQVMIDELKLHGEMTAESFVEERESQLDLLFPEAQLLPGAYAAPCAVIRLM